MSSYESDIYRPRRKEYQNKVTFLLCGKLSDNPQAMKKDELEVLCDGTYIQWLGHRTDVKELLQQLGNLTTDYEEFFGKKLGKGR